MNNFEAYLTSLSAAEQALSGEGGAVEKVSAAMKQLTRVSDDEPALGALIERLDAVSIELDDIAAEVSGILSASEFDEGKARYVEERIAKINSLKKKYGSSVQEILSECEKLKEKRDKFDDASAEAEILNKKIVELEDKLYENTQKISALRRAAAEKFAQSVTGELKQLGMKNAAFVVDFAPLPEKESAKFSPQGSDEAQFLFSANSGQPPRPLSKIISGGELSRFMLALKNCLPSGFGIQTMIFDEIDTGISGETARAASRFWRSPTCLSWRAWRTGSISSRSLSKRAAPLRRLPRSTGRACS